jgi:hypothetical protein
MGTQDYEMHNRSGTIQPTSLFPVSHTVPPSVHHNLGVNKAFLEEKCEPPSHKSHDVVGNCSSKDTTENGTSDTTQDQGQSSALYLQGNGESGSKDDSRNDAEDV